MKHITECTRTEKTIRPGYIYVLTHPSDPKLYKIGKTVLNPKKRLAQHNTNYKKYAGQIVKETGQKWQLKTFIEVPDPYRAESAFWASTPFADILFLGGIEIQQMEWGWVQKGLEATKKAGIRPSSKHERIPDHVYAYTRWMKNRLKGRDISLLGYVKSRCSGKAIFRCCCGYEWKTWVRNVAAGEGCPSCGIGERSPEEMLCISKPAYLCLLINPDKPGFIKITLEFPTSSDRCEKHINDGWVQHRYRDVEEAPELAESLIWELLGVPKPKNDEKVEIEQHVAEDAFRSLIGLLRKKIAFFMWSM